MKTGKTSITTYLASSSGSRFCFVCEERITDRSLVLKFRETDDAAVRVVSEIAMHPICAAYLKENLP